MIIIVNKKRFALSAACIAAVVLLAVGFAARPVKKIIYPLKYADIIYKYSSQYNLDPYLVMGVISAESRFDPNAESHRNAKGLMQIRDDTARWCAEKFNTDVSAENLFDPETNIAIGCVYINYLLQIFGGEVETALAAYNGGQGNVSDWLNDGRYSSDGKRLYKIPFGETERYVEKVIARQQIYWKLYR